MTPRVEARRSAGHVSRTLRRLVLALVGAAVIGQVPPAFASSAVVPVSARPVQSASRALAVNLSQTSTAYNAATNTATVRVTATSTAAAAPWRYSFAVHGAKSTSGTSGDTTVTVTLVNDCSITTQSVTVAITAAAGTGSAAATLDRAMCPPPPPLPHASDSIMAGPTLTEAAFTDCLRAAGSPALAEAHAIYATLIAGGINPAFALGTFQAESGSGTRGYAVTTKNWGNILYHSWEASYGAMPYTPGNGYTYAMYPTWLASVQAYAQLLAWYAESGYTTVSSTSARWLGIPEGATRHVTYLGNITRLMTLLPRDAVPVVTTLLAPVASRAAVGLRWAATDNVRVTGYQVRTRLGSGAWGPLVALSRPSTVLQLANGSWTIAVRAGDGDGNWSPWRFATVAVDATPPTMNGLAAPSVIRSPTGAFVAAWSAKDDQGVTGFQYRVHSSAATTLPAPHATTASRTTFRLAAGTWLLDVRARDAVGNWSAWRTRRVVVPADDRSYAFSSGTVRRTGSSDFQGTYTTTSRTGARLTAKFTGSEFYLIGRSGPAYGRLKVTVDGRSYLVDTGTFGGARAKVIRSGLVLFSLAVPAGSHTVTITNIGTRNRPTIAIDGLAFVP